MKLPITIPAIELSQETGTITNALDLDAWLRRNSPDWSHIENVALHYQMNRIEHLELLALTFGLALERSKQAAIERELRTIQPVVVLDPFATPLDPDDYETHVAAYLEVANRPINPEDLPETIKPKDPAELAPAIFSGLGLFFAIAAGVLGMTGYGLAAALCGVTSILSLVRASKYPA